MVWFSSLCKGVLEMAQQLSPPSPPPPPLLILLFWFSDIYFAVNAQFAIQCLCFTERLVTKIICYAEILWSENADNPYLPFSLH